MTRHKKQSEAKQSKNKMLDVPVNIGVTLCQQRLNRSLLTTSKVGKRYEPTDMKISEHRGRVGDE